MPAPFSEEGLVLGTLPGLPLATKDQQPEGVHAGLRLDQGPRGQGAKGPQLELSCLST